MNIFVRCRNLGHCESFLQAYLPYQTWANRVVIARDRKEKGFEVFYPSDYTGKFQL